MSTTRKVELVRHVRTASGVAIFKMPIGSPITKHDEEVAKACAKGLSIADIVPSAVAKNEQEVVTGGRYTVTKIQIIDGITNVYVTQKDFNAN